MVEIVYEGKAVVIDGLWRGPNGSPADNRPASGPIGRARYRAATFSNPSASTSRYHVHPPWWLRPISSSGTLA